MWVLSDLESSREAVQLTVGSEVEIPTLLYSSAQAPVSDIVTTFNASIKNYCVADRSVWMAEIEGSGSTTVVADTSLQQNTASLVDGYLLWDPYWYVEFADVPILRGAIAALGLITSNEQGELAFDIGVDFGSLESNAKASHRRIRFRCVDVRPATG